MPEAFVYGIGRTKFIKSYESTLPFDSFINLKNSVKKGKAADIVYTIFYSSKSLETI